MTTASQAQHGMWFTERLGEAGSAYHMPLALWLDGPLDTAALVRACDAVLARHTVLVSAFTECDGVLRLVPAADRPGVRREELTPDLVRRETMRPFDLRHGPLVRFVLAADGPDRHLLLIVAHHLVFDGHSKDILLRDLATAYAGDPLPPLAVSYAGHAAGEADRLAGLLVPAREHWATRWREPAETVLPGLRRTGPGARLAGHVDIGVDIVAPDGVTRFEYLLSVLGALLSRYGNAEPVIGIDVGTRTPETADTIGLFVNELPVRVRPSAGQTLHELALATRSELRELYRFRTMPLARAVHGFAPRLAFAPVSVSYRRRGGTPQFAGLRATADWTGFNFAARNPLHLQVVEAADGTVVRLMHPAGDVDAGSVARHLRALLAADPGAPLDEVVLDEPGVSSGYGPPPPPPSTVVELFEAQVARAPNAPAVTGAGRTLTYAALHDAAGRLAGRLRGDGVQRGDTVAVRLPRTPDLLVALLGVLKAGAAYVPVDGDHPPARQAYILDDAAPAALLTSVDAPPAVSPAVTPAPGDLAYVTYTSGSTGRPKGVEVTHGSVANLLRSMAATLDSAPGDAWLAVASHAFDMSVPELFLPLVTGGTVVLAADRHDGRALLAGIRAHGVTHVHATPATWRLLLDAGYHEPGVVALIGAETVPPDLATRVRARSRELWNLYGPTETTVWSTMGEITDDEVTIGTPIAGTGAHVLDPAGRPVLAGLPGELYLGGAGLARGYRGKPDLTGARFVSHGLGRLYRTGDQVRWRPDGRLEFLGRLDGQIKLRGYRIEPGEVEAVLRECPGVGEVAVVLREESLVAYVAGQPDLAELRRGAAAMLPRYMMPSAFVVLDALPLTPNGKLDRDALPAPRAGRADPPAAVPAGLASDIRDIWREVLRVDEIDLDDNLFELGGHSLSITQIAARMRTRLRVDLPLHVFFDAPTIAGLLAWITDADGAGPPVAVGSMTIGSLSTSTPSQ